MKIESSKPQNISAQNAQQLYDSLSAQNRAAVDAILNMMTALFIGIAQVQNTNEQKQVQK